MRVLLIEDDSATAQSIELMLKSESFNVYTTDLGEEGVDLGKHYFYDIILLDLDLPDMSGFEVLRSLRASKVKTPIRSYRPATSSSTLTLRRSRFRGNGSISPSRSTRCWNSSPSAKARRSPRKCS